MIRSALSMGAVPYAVWTNTDSLATARCAHTAAMLPNGKVLVVGGYNSSDNTIGSGELYDPETGTWNFTGGLATGRAFHTATLLANGKVLIPRGYYGSGGGALTRAQLYIPVSGTCGASGSLPIGRIRHSGMLLPNGKVFVAGGFTTIGAYVATTQLYDPATANWSGTGQ
jgi:hypothetical protein